MWLFLLQKRSMDASDKLEILKDTCSSDTEIDQVLGKLFDVTLNQHRRRLKRYEQDLKEFENNYDMDSKAFYERFQAGKLGDAMDFFECAGLYELRQDIVEKIHRLESAL